MESLPVGALRVLCTSRGVIGPFLEKQDMAAEALLFKTDVLWAQLDALWSAYVEPGRVPPGGWQPGEGLA